MSQQCYEVADKRMLAINDRRTEKQMQAIVDRRAITDRHSEK